MGQYPPFIPGMAQLAAYHTRQAIPIKLMRMIAPPSNRPIFRRLPLWLSARSNTQ